jgi:hypothetical protein
MKLRILVSAGILALILLGVCVLSVAGRAADDEKESKAPNTYFKTVGVYVFDNATRRRNAGEEFSKVLFERFERKFPDVKFVYITPEDSGFPEGPVLLKHAIRLGEKYEVEAIIDGTFLGYVITGGTWPNRATPSPEANTHAKLRVVETETGTIVKAYVETPKRPKVYPSRIRTERELWNQAIRDVIDKWADEMRDDGIFYEEKKEG